jgi:hypothetical protein
MFNIKYICIRDKYLTESRQMKDLASETDFSPLPHYFLAGILIKEIYRKYF